MSAIIILHPAEPSRSKERPCFYDAETVVDGVRYVARARHGASYDLARKLVAAGIADQPVEIRQEGLRGGITFRSLYRMAERTVTEGSSRPLHSQRWGDLREAFLGAPTRDSLQGTGSGVRSTAGPIHPLFCRSYRHSNGQGDSRHPSALPPRPAGGSGITGAIQD